MEPGELTRHELKTWPPYFEDVMAGRKNFELRKNDRDFHEGDELLLREYAHGEYTGRECSRSVSYVLGGYGLEDGYVALGLTKAADTIEDLTVEVRGLRTANDQRKLKIKRLKDTIEGQEEALDRERIKAIHQQFVDDCEEDAYGTSGTNAGAHARGADLLLLRLEAEFDRSSPGSSSAAGGGGGEELATFPKPDPAPQERLEGAVREADERIVVELSREDAIALTTPKVMDRTSGCPVEGCDKRSPAHYCLPYAKAQRSLGKQLAAALSNTPPRAEEEEAVND